MCSQIWPQVNGFGLQRSWKVKMAEFWRFCFSIITFNSEDLRQWFYHHCIQLFKPRRMMYNMTQKSKKWNLTSGQGHDLTQIGHVAYHSIRIDEKTQWCCFEACSTLLSKVISQTWMVTFGDVIWPQMTLWGFTDGFLNIEPLLWHI